MGIFTGQTSAHALPVVRQCQLLALSRSTAYYQPTPVSAAELALMRPIDELDLHYPVLHVLSEWLIYHPKHFQTKFLHSLLTSFWDDMVALDSNCCHLYFLYVVFVLV